MSEAEESKTEDAPRRKVLIPVDGSKHSERALDWYCENVRQEGDLLVLCHCLELPPIPPAPFPYGVGYYEDWTREVEDARTESESLLQTCGIKCKDRDIPRKLIREERDRPGHAICLLAKEENIALIIMGSRGLGKIRRTIMGSVSDYVVHHAHIPVAVVPSRSQDQEK